VSVLPRVTLICASPGPDHQGMAQSVSVIITDDLDGSQGAQTVTFGLEGASYQIDLSAKNRARLEKALAPFIAAGRKAARRGRVRPAGRPGGGVRTDRAAIRAWAKAAGLAVCERGRISAEVIRRYEEVIGVRH
jgi:Lsr2